MTFSSLEIHFFLNPCNQRQMYGRYIIYTRVRCFYFHFLVPNRCSLWTTINSLFSEVETLKKNISHVVSNLTTSSVFSFYLSRNILKIMQTFPFDTPVSLVFFLWFCCPPEYGKYKINCLKTSCYRFPPLLTIKTIFSFPDPVVFAVKCYPNQCRLRLLSKLPLPKSNTKSSWSEGN